MEEPVRWRNMRSAPRDGSRILVTIRASEQGPGAVDLVFWSRGDQYGAEAWRSSDSAPGRIISYAEPELKCWMPLPAADTGPATTGQASTGKASTGPASLPGAWEGDDEAELDGSGI